MKLTEKLLAATKAIWQDYNLHPFVLGIQNGTLPRQKFRYYIIQDYLYLEEYAKVFAIGVAKAKSPQTAALFAQYMAQMHAELNIHNGYMGLLGITEAEIVATPRALDNLSYTSYMLRIAYELGEVEILTAVLSCAYSYEVIAKKIVQNNPAATDNAFYGEWIKGYAADEYTAENVILLNTLDELTAGYSEAQTQKLIEIFTVCSKYELNFWQMAWQMS